MPATLKQLGRLALLACTLLVPAAAYAEQVYADLDGDGIADVVRLRNSPSNILEVWLSRTQTTRLVRTKHPIHHIVASDLNGDGRMEIVSSDDRAAVRVWQLHAGNLKPLPRRSHKPALSDSTPRKELDDDDDAGSNADSQSTTPVAIDVSRQTIVNAVRTAADFQTSDLTPPEVPSFPHSVRGPPSIGTFL